MSDPGVPGSVVRGPWKGTTPARERELVEALERCEKVMQDLRDVIVRREPPDPEELRELQTEYELALTYARLVLGKKSNR